MIDRDIKTFVLRALIAANDAPMTDSTLKASITTAFQHVAIPAADLTRYLEDMEHAGLLARTEDELLGPVWGFTIKGKNRAQQLR